MAAVGSCAGGRAVQMQVFQMSACIWLCKIHSGCRCQSTIKSKELTSKEEKLQPLVFIKLLSTLNEQTKIPTKTLFGEHNLFQNLMNVRQAQSDKFTHTQFWDIILGKSSTKLLL